MSHRGKGCSLGSVRGSELPACAPVPSVLFGKDRCRLLCTVSLVEGLAVALSSESLCCDPWTCKRKGQCASDAVVRSGGLCALG